MRRARVVALALAAAMAAPARAQEPPRPLRHDATVDLSVTCAAALSWVALGLLGPELAPLSCHWCAPPAIDQKVRSALLWGNPRAAAVASDVGLAALPAGLLAFGWFSARGAGDRDAFWTDTLIIAEA